MTRKGSKSEKNEPDPRWGTGSRKIRSCRGTTRRSGHLLKDPVCWQAGDDELRQPATV